METKKNVNITDNIGGEPVSRKPRNRRLVLTDWFAGIAAFGFAGAMLLPVSKIVAAVALIIAFVGIVLTPVFLKNTERFRPSNIVLLGAYVVLFVIILTAAKYELTSVAVVILLYIVVNFIINISPMFQFTILRSNRYRKQTEETQSREPSANSENSDRKE